MKKILFITCALILLTPFASAKAQFDQRCWLENSYGSQLGCVEQGGVFYQSDETADACGGKEYIDGKPIGFCQAVGDVQTAVSFGGRTKFADFGQFIKYIYNYGISIAGILAVVMIIIAGAQWILSGGNAERITSAQKKISGAIVGLVLAVLSYSILNTINPYLINLRLPQVWMINRQELTPPNCNAIKGRKLALAAEPGKKIKTSNFSAANLKDLKPEEVKCGYQYFVEGTPGLTCEGNYCEQKKHICFKSKCIEATLRGEIKNTNFATYLSGQIQNNSGILAGAADLLIGLVAEGFEWPWAEDQEFYVICKNGDYDRIEHSGKNEPDNDSSQKDDQHLIQQHWILVPNESVDEGIEYCNSKGGTRGFAYSLDFNEEGEAWDERHLIGWDRDKKIAVDLGRKQSEMEKNVFSKNCINKYLFTAEEVKAGISEPFDINVDRICDIDTGKEGEQARIQCYGNFAAGKGYADLGYEKKPEECR